VLPLPLNSSRNVFRYHVVTDINVVSGGFLLKPGEYGMRQVQGRVCRNCIYQQLKRVQGRVSLESCYCPLDLFSGDNARRCHALHSLLKTPQNNLVVFNQENGQQERLSLLSQADLVSLIDAVLTDHLPLLARIQRAQRLTALTLPRVADLLCGLSTDDWNALTREPLNQDVADRLTQTPPFTASVTLQDYKPCLRNPHVFAAEAVLSETAAIVASLPIDDVVNELRLLLLEMTARDVSLMIAFTPYDDNVQSPGGEYGHGLCIREF
jgi:hypothetical protein